MAGKVLQESESVFRKEGRVISAGHHTMLKKTVKYPWDYRVEYFQMNQDKNVLFECGPLSNYAPNWPSEDILNASSSLQDGIRNNFGWSVVFSFPKSLSTDQKNVGGPNTFCVYPYSNRWNIGGFAQWLTNPTTSQSSGISSVNTKTRVSAVSTGNNMVAVTIQQIGGSSVTVSSDLTGKRFNAEKYMPVLNYYSSWDGGYISTVYKDTRFYECRFDFGLPGNLETHVRFVPCILGGVPYVCEMYSGTMISNSQSGTVTAGPQVSDDYEAWSN